jgi:DHA1 family multidrug resistance protein-like MFS transporter
MISDKHKHLIILFFTLVVIMLGFGMVLPILPFYVERLGATGSQLGLLTASYALMQFIFAPVWGSLSDRLGRKPILLLGILGNGLSLLMFGLAGQLWQLFIARTLSGILSSATFPTAMAYVSDSTSEEERGGGMGILGAAMGIGMVLGPGLGGWLAGDSLSQPFFFAAGLALVTLVLVLLFLPESLAVEQRTQQAGQAPLAGPRVLGRALLSPAGLIFFMAFLVSFGLTNFEGIFGLYALEKLAYGPERVGTILSVVAVVAAGGQAVLTGPLTRRLGEVSVIRMTLLTSTIGFFLMLLANGFLAVLLTTGFFVLSNALLRPAVLSLASKNGEEKQGTVMGLTNSFMSLGRIIGPIWAGLLFDINFNYPYLSGALVLFGGFLISLLAMSRAPQSSRLEQKKVESELLPLR